MPINIQTYGSICCTQNPTKSFNNIDTYKVNKETPEPLGWNPKVGSG